MVPVGRPFRRRFHARRVELRQFARARRRRRARSRSPVSSRDFAARNHGQRFSVGREDWDSGPHIRRASAPSARRRKTGIRYMLSHPLSCKTTASVRLSGDHWALRIDHPPPRSVGEVYSVTGSPACPLRRIKLHDIQLAAEIFRRAIGIGDTRAIGRPARVPSSSSLASGRNSLAIPSSLTTIRSSWPRRPVSNRIHRPLGDHCGSAIGRLARIAGSGMAWVSRFGAPPAAATVQMLP